MSKIQILPQNIVGKIAAGEVIERPASVVKELVENSFDAAAQSIEVHLSAAGKKLIQVKDTGSGIEPEDIFKIFLRHATSKISSESDLEAISTLGFRGEALYSIAAIADVNLKSKTADNDSGWETHVRDSKTILNRPVPLTTGTDIEVKELFFNTPARRKFLKSDTTELNQILDLFTPYCLLYPDVRFLLTHNGKEIINLSPAPSQLSRIAQALNLKKEFIITADHYFNETNISIKLYLGDINIHRTTKDLQFIFVNGRPVDSRHISFQVNQIYRSLLPNGVHPFFCVFITLDPSWVDVNVHPTKRQVKIKDEQVLIPSLRAFCEKTLMRGGAPKRANIFPSPLEPLTLNGGLATFERLPLPEQTQYQMGFSEYSSGAHQPPQTASHRDLKEKLKVCRYLAYFKKKYLIFESPDSLLLIDAHAAHERITFESLLKEAGLGKIEVQRLLTPFLLSLTNQQMLTWEKTTAKLQELGFETTLWERNSIAIHTHPRLINTPEMAVSSLLSDINLNTNPLETLIRRACRTSLMQGQDLKESEAVYLKTQLLSCDCPFTCPHGRPVVIEIEEKSLNRNFLR